MKTRIHVNQHNIKANAKGANLPVLTAKTYKGNQKGNQAIIVDSVGRQVAKVVYHPYNPLSCGAKCWIETNHKVIVR
jgi:hypothetical protein